MCTWWWPRPGRAVDLINRGALELDRIETVVLDEADEMLDMGFTDDIEAILDATPAERQTVLFSATMPKRIAAIARKYQRDPVRIEIGKQTTESGKALIRQTVYFVQRSHKASALGRVLDIEGPDAAIVFCRTRHEVDELTVTMNGRGYRAEALHGGMDQGQRDRVMGRLRDGTAELLIATDVAARGLDVDTLTHVVNYDVPAAAESYVHRIGRVGRAGREGVAITLAEPRERRQIGNIERLMKQSITVSKVPTVADLREKQIEATVEALNEALASDDLDDYQGVLHALAGEDPRSVALAAVKLVHEAPRRHARRARDPRCLGRPGSGARAPRASRQGRVRQGAEGAGLEGEGRQGRPTAPPASSTSTPGARPASVPPTWSVPSPTRAVSPAARSGPIRIAESHSVVGVPEDRGRAGHPLDVEGIGPRQGRPGPPLRRVGPLGSGRCRVFEAERPHRRRQRDVVLARAGCPGTRSPTLVVTPNQ